MDEWMDGWTDVTLLWASKLNNLNLLLPLSSAFSLKLIGDLVSLVPLFLCSLSFSLFISLSLSVSLLSLSVSLSVFRS